MFNTQLWLFRRTRTRQSSKASSVAAVIKVLRQAEDGDFVFVWFTVPRTELSAVAAFVTVSVEVQRLETVLEAWDRNGDVGAVRADIHALAANVVTFKAASSFLRDKLDHDRHCSPA